MKIKTIAIIGLGLMGGSLAIRCRKVFPKATILGVTRNRSALALAKKRKWIHQGFSQIDTSLKDADIVILCTPVNTFKSSLTKLDRVLKRNAVVTDVGSTKAAICKQLPKQGFKNIQFVGAHPMVGSHAKGIGACSADLYDEGFTFVMKMRKGQKVAHDLAFGFWSKISPKVILMNPSDHDKVVGEISHLPHVIAVCLMLSTSRGSLPFAAKGFKDTTRIAAGDESIWLPIFQSNRKAVLSALNCFERNLKLLKRELLSQDDKELSLMLKKACKKRQQISF